MSCNLPEAEGLLDFDPNDRSGAKVATAAHQFGGEKKRSSHWAIDHFHDRRHQHGFQSHGRALTSAHRNFLHLFELCKMTWMYIEVMQGRYKPFRAPSNQYEAMFNSGTSLKRLNESHTSLRTTARFWYRCPSLLIDDHRFSCLQACFWLVMHVDSSDSWVFAGWPRNWLWPTPRASSNKTMPCSACRQWTRQFQACENLNVRRSSS